MNNVGVKIIGDWPATLIECECLCHKNNFETSCGSCELCRDINQVYVKPTGRTTKVSTTTHKKLKNKQKVKPALLVSISVSELNEIDSNGLSNLQRMIADLNKSFTIELEVTR